MIFDYLCSPKSYSALNRLRIIPFLLLTVLCTSLGAQEISNFSQPAHIVSPEIAGDEVTLRFAGEYATEVFVDGDWLGEPVLMQKHDGIWEITFKGLLSDCYSYKYVIDGVEALDPANCAVQRDGGRYSNIFVVEGGRGGNFVQGSHRGTVSFVWYDSAILGTNRRMAVYTPYGYETSPNKQYPVLYLLHEEGQDEESWLNMARVAQVMDNLIQQGRAVPMIVVMPNCNPDEQATCTLGLPETSNTRTASSMVFVSSLIHEIIPFVETNYRAVSKKNRRCIAGMGRGGEQILNAIILYPDYFDYVCPFSCGVEDNGRLHEDFFRVKKAGVKLFWTGCGTSDTGNYASSQVLHEALNYIHLDHTYYGNKGGHNWRTWRQYLNNFAPLIFKYYKD